MFSGHFAKRGQLPWTMCFFAILWTKWRELNAHIFNKQRIINGENYEVFVSWVRIRASSKNEFVDIHLIGFFIA